MLLVALAGLATPGCLNLPPAPEGATDLGGSNLEAGAPDADVDGGLADAEVQPDTGDVQAASDAEPVKELWEPEPGCVDCPMGCDESIGFCHQGFEIAAGEAHTCLRRNDATLWCWGRGAEGQLALPFSINPYQPFLVEGLDPVLDIAVGLRHTCALTSPGGPSESTVSCWGANDQMQLGGGAEPGDQAYQPVQVGALAPGQVHRLFAGEQTTCATDDVNHELYCWGWAQEGEHPDFALSLEVWPEPHLLEAFSGVSLETLAVGRSHICVAPSSGGVRCFGHNLRSQLGDGSTTQRPAAEATTLFEGRTVIALGAGYAHSCALYIGEGGREIACWGDNTFGQAGASYDTTATVTTPRVMTLNATPDHLWVGSDNTCLASNEIPALFCIGNGKFGQLASLTNTSNHAPSEIVGLYTRPVHLAIGNAHLCALTKQLIECWGDNQWGQMGLGSTSLNPVTDPLDLYFEN